MSQIDKIIYLPLLFWFIILFSLLYFFIFSYFFSIFLTILKVRIIFYKEIKNHCLLKYSDLINLFLQNNLLFLCMNYSNIYFLKKFNELKNL